jgi:hypothetical protein
MNRDLMDTLEQRSSLGRIGLAALSSEWAMKLLGRLERVEKKTGSLNHRVLGMVSGGFKW